MLKGGLAAHAKVEDRSAGALLVRWTVWELRDEWRPYWVFDWSIIVGDERKLEGCRKEFACGQLEGRCCRERSVKGLLSAVKRSGAES
jgi:hypothetical protein